MKRTKTKHDLDEMLFEISVKMDVTLAAMFKNFTMNRVREAKQMFYYVAYELEMDTLNKIGQHVNSSDSSAFKGWKRIKRDRDLGKLSLHARDVLKFYDL